VLKSDERACSRYEARCEYCAQDEGGQRRLLLRLDDGQRHDTPSTSSRARTKLTHMGLEVVPAVLRREEGEEGLLPQEKLGEVGRVVRVDADRLALGLRVAAGEGERQAREEGEREEERERRSQPPVEFGDKEEERASDALELARVHPVVQVGADDAVKLAPQELGVDLVGARVGALGLVQHARQRGVQVALVALVAPDGRHDAAREKEEEKVS